MSHDAGLIADLYRPRPKSTPKEILRARHYRRIYAAYRSLFFDDEGQLNRDAEIVLNDLVQAATLGEMSGTLTDQELRELYGRRKMLLHLINRLDRDGTKRDQLTQMIRESENA